MLEDHNVVLNHLLKFYRYDHKVFESLERIKNGIKELAQQSTNKQSTPPSLCSTCSKTCKDTNVFISACCDYSE
jgi:hypothetical protein